MKTEQIKLVLAISREKSLSKAAATLYISQPNASNVLKALESELGFLIFHRTKAGMIPTAEGIEFIEYAEVIERALDAISRIKKTKKVDFRILSLKTRFAELAFEQLSEKYLSENYAVDFNFQIVSTTEDSFNMLEKGQGDVAIAICRKKTYESLAQNVSKRHFAIVSLDETHLEITCNRFHPLLRGEKIDFNQLSSYTCFSSIHAANSELYVPYLLEKAGIDAKNSIVIDSSDTRYRLISKSNGYLISTPLPDDIKNKFSLASSAIPDSGVIIFAAYRKESQKKGLIQEYLNYCRSFLG